MQSVTFECHIFHLIHVGTQGDYYINHTRSPRSSAQLLQEKGEAPMVSSEAALHGSRSNDYSLYNANRVKTEMQCQDSVASRAFFVHVLCFQYEVYFRLYNNTY